MRIALIIPPYNGILGFPLGIASLARSIELKSHCQVCIVDFAQMGVNWGETRAYIERKLKDVEIIGISATTISYKSAIEIAKVIKEANKEKVVIFGGIHPTLNADIVISRHPEVDIVIRGEAEESLPRLLNSIQKGRHCEGVKGCVYRLGNKITHNEEAPIILKLDNLDYRYDRLINRHDYSTEVFHYRTPSASIITSRGCEFRCSYCIQSRNCEKKGVRYRSVKNVLEEIKYLIARGYIDFHFEDDSFTLDRKRVLQLCKEISRLDSTITWNCETRPDLVDIRLLEVMKSAGCMGIFFGVESFAQTVLNRANRNISVKKMKEGIINAKNLGIKVFASIQIGLPGESKSTIETTIRMLKKLRPWKVGINLATMYPGTIWFINSGIASDVYEDYPGEPELDELLIDYVGHGMGGLHPYFIRPGSDLSAIPVHDICAIKKILERYKSELGPLMWSAKRESISLQ